MKSELLAVFREISARLDSIDAHLADPTNGLAAIRTKVDMSVDDHDEALRLHEKRLNALDGGAKLPNGHTDAE